MGNIAILEGRLGGDPEAFSKGCKFTLATDRYKSESPDWHRCVAFGKTAEVISQYCKKGSHILIQGRIQYGSYEDKEGNTRYTTDIVVNEFSFINSGNKEKKEQTQEEYRKANNLPTDEGFEDVTEALKGSPLSGPSFEDDEIPF